MSAIVLDSSNERQRRKQIQLKSLSWRNLAVAFGKYFPCYGLFLFLFTHEMRSPRTSDSNSGWILKVSHSECDPVSNCASLFSHFCRAALSGSFVIHAELTLVFPLFLQRVPLPTLSELSLCIMAEPCLARRVHNIMSFWLFLLVVSSPYPEDL